MGSDEVQEHEEKKLQLENTIAQLKAQKEELEYILSQHKSECQLVVPGLRQQQPLSVAVKSEPVLVETIEINTNRPGGLKAKRPLSLNIESAQLEAKASTT